jgi:hypothetical protein
MSTCSVFLCSIEKQTDGQLLREYFEHEKNAHKTRALHIHIRGENEFLLFACCLLLFYRVFVTFIKKKT